MWDSTLSSFRDCRDFFLPTVSHIRYAIICDSKYLKILQFAFVGEFVLVAFHCVCVMSSFLWHFFFTMKVIKLWKNFGVAVWKFCYCTRNCESWVVVRFLIPESTPWNTHIPYDILFSWTFRSLGASAS